MAGLENFSSSDSRRVGAKQLENDRINWLLLEFGQVILGKVSVGQFALL